MVQLTDIWHLPMVMSFIIPLALVSLFVIFLLWEARLPVERRFLRKLRKLTKKERVAHHKLG